MKKFVFALVMAILLSTNAQAETYHGIDIDKVYARSDWSSKDKIKSTIDDYTLLLKYQTELKTCSNQTEMFSCYDKLAEKILAHLYVYPDNNIKTYQQFRKILSKAYSIQSCLNKYEWPSGNLCEANSQTELLNVLHQYIHDLIASSKEKIVSYLPELKNYE